MTNKVKRRLACGIGAVLAAAAFATLTTSTASAAPATTSPHGIAVPAGSRGATAVLVASMEGRNEVAVGSRHGQALALIGIRGNTLSYSVSWHGIGAPTAALIHAGGQGANGPVVVPLFTTRHRANGFAAGTVRVRDRAVLAELTSNPSGFYTDLRTKRFPRGAVRAQLHLLNHPVTDHGVAAVQESVIQGSQIYACTLQSDGSFAFTQNNVDAHLTGGIHHTFVQSVVGPPQWQAPDGSAVSGTLVSKNANGDGNIAELNLDATQIGRSTGLLSRAVEVLRLNTVGGVAPTGTCNPQRMPTVGVPYGADYVFING